MSSSLTLAAAENNASWCAAFCRSHGLAGQWSPGLWCSPRRTPPLYPDAVTIRPHVDAEALLARIDVSEGCSVKDSFCDLDLGRFGFNPLFDAEWLASDRSDASVPWVVVGEHRLGEWERGWGERPADPGFFRPALLDDPDVRLLGRLDTDGRLCAGAVANRAANVIGLSNLFDVEGDLEAVWRGAARAARDELGPLPVVAYGSGKGLEGARRACFEAIGALRVWIFSPAEAR